MVVDIEVVVVVAAVVVLQIFLHALCFSENASYGFFHAHDVFLDD